MKIKEKLLLLFAAMCCLTSSAWSVTTKTETITCNGSKTVTGKSGIMVMSTALSGDSWSVSGSNVLVVKAGNVAITKIVVNGDYSFLKCSQLSKSGNTWKQNGYDITSMITFTSTSTAKVSSLEITYHKHAGEGCVVTHHEAKEATCTEDGMTTECWECDCGLFFEDEACTKELDSNPVIPAKGHTLEYHEPKAADCFDGNVEYWHCSVCNKNFSDAACTNEITGSVVLPGGHSGMNHFARVEPKCTEDGNIEYWHCTVCDKYYSDSDYKNEIPQAETVLTALGHDLSHVEHQNPSVNADGVMEHWYCGRCGKNFTDNAAEHEINGSTVLPRWEADAILVSNTFTDESYLLGEEAVVTFEEDGDNLMLKLAVDGNDYAYEVSETDNLKIDFSHTFKLKANQDPDHPENFYTTFYTSEGAYRLPFDGTRAYIDAVDGDEQILSSIGSIIHKGEAVLLKAKQSEITLMPSANTDEASTDNLFEGTDEAKTLGADQFALSLGQNGVGFYLWAGRNISANKAYLTLDENSTLKALKFEFGTEGGYVPVPPAGVKEAQKSSLENGQQYDLFGVPTNGKKGYYIKNNKVFYKK